MYYPSMTEVPQQGDPGENINNFLQRMQELHKEGKRTTFSLFPQEKPALEINILGKPVLVHLRPRKFWGGIDVLVNAPAHMNLIPSDANPQQKMIPKWDETSEKRYRNFQQQVYAESVEPLVQTLYIDELIAITLPRQNPDGSIDLQVSSSISPDIPELWQPNIHMLSFGEYTKRRRELMNIDTAKRNRRSSS